MKKILICDDEPLVRRSLSRVFAAQGFEIIEATDGQQGLELWRKHRPDCVFLDVLMPGLTGPQVLSEIEPEIRSQSKIILISAFTGEYSVDSAKNLGADHFIPKPFEDIFAIVKLVLGMLK